jgi:hypothetical protein
MIIELNARPGLSIQVANAAGLAPRVAVIEALKAIDPDPQSRAAFSKRQFAAGPGNHPPRLLRTRSDDPKP